MNIILKKSNNQMQISKIEYQYIWWKWSSLYLWWYNQQQQLILKYYPFHEYQYIQFILKLFADMQYNLLYSREAMDTWYVGYIYKDVKIVIKINADVLHCSCHNQSLSKFR